MVFHCRCVYMCMCRSDELEQCEKYTQVEFLASARVLRVKQPLKLGHRNIVKHGGKRRKTKKKRFYFTTRAEKARQTAIF